MELAQPALLYIVPGVLIPIAILGLVRGEFRDLWEGDKRLDEEVSGPCIGVVCPSLIN